MAWIKWSIGLESKPEVFEMASQLSLSRPAVAGCLMVFWAWVDGVSEDGWIQNARPAYVDSLVGVEGFAQAMESVGWLIVEYNGMRLPNFDRHNGSTAKQRALEQKRKADARRAEKVSSSCPGTNGTAARQEPYANGTTIGLEERRREERKGEERKNENLPPPPPLEGAISGAEPDSWEAACGVMKTDVLRTPEFKRAWEDWAAYRRERKATLTEHSIQKQIKDMEAMGHDLAIAAIENSIRQGYQGLVPPGRRKQRPVESAPKQAEFAEAAQCTVFRFKNAAGQPDSTPQEAEGGS